MYSLFYDQMKTEIQTETSYIAIALNIDQNDYLSALNTENSSNRITIVANDGTVLFDTDSDPATMENHLNRPEIVSAIAKGTGEATRYSSTLNQQTYYYAVKLNNGNILRIASVTSSVITTLISGIPFMILLMALLTFITLYVSSKQTNNLIAPINSLNLDNPLANETYDDLSPLLIRLDQQKRDNQQQLQLINEQHREFDSITNNMQEGLIILGSNKSILSINQSACQIFNIHYENAINKNYLVLNRHEEFVKTIEDALNGNVRETSFNANGRLYQLIINPVTNNPERAAVLMLMDITEQHERENLRKEFSANVSHELKTPLTSIIGYAEIIENGIAKKDDIPKFAGQINSEAKQLLNLINDIILLSHLDESTAALHQEKADLRKITEDVVRSLQHKADQEDIKLLIKGESLSINGFTSILYEMIYNLVDNAIKYNKPHGQVVIQLEQHENQAIIEVRDNGIGIAKEHFNRIFERFYRVDKSHSRSTGGTGLGLSIVKNGAKLHNAVVTLESQENIGSSFRITFPLAE